MKNKMKIEVNGKQYTFRFNSEKLQFECNYGYKDNFGSRQSRIIRGRSVEELAENLETTIKKIKDNSILNNTITLRNFFDFYISNIAKMKNNHRTIRTKISCFKKIPKYVQDKPIKDITIVDLQSMYSKFEEKYASNTIANAHELINTVFNQAINYKIISENVNRKCSIKGFTKGEKKYLSTEDIKKILNYIRTHIKYRHLYAPVLFLAFTGCRIGECLGLKIDCLDTKNNVVKIKAQFTSNEFSDTLKTESSNREIKVPYFVMKELEHDAKLSHNDFVFSCYNGNKFTGKIGYDHFSKNMKKVYEACGLEYRTFKQFRNSFAKTAILNGIPLKVIQSILGHSRISTTADIYGELESKDTFFVADKLVEAYNAQSSNV